MVRFGIGEGNQAEMRETCREGLSLAQAMEEQERAAFFQGMLDQLATG